MGAPVPYTVYRDCEELCTNRAYLEKVLGTKSVDVARCIRVCRGLRSRPRRW